MTLATTDSSYRPIEREERPRLPRPDEGGWTAYCEQRRRTNEEFVARVAATAPVTDRPWDWELDGVE